MQRIRRSVGPERLECWIARLAFEGLRAGTMSYERKAQKPPDVPRGTLPRFA